MKTNIRYRWKYWSLFQEFDYIMPKEWDCKAGGTDRIFTINPRFIWQRIRCWYYPDPFTDCHNWLNRNHHWDKGHDAFMHAIMLYANHSEPGQLVRLNPKLLR